MLDTALVLLVIAGLLVIVGLSQPLAIRLRLPPSVLLAAVGVGIGAFPVVSAQFGLSNSVDVAAGVFSGPPARPGTVIFVFLPLLGFEAWVFLRVQPTLPDAPPLPVLALIA